MEQNRRREAGLLKLRRKLEEAELQSEVTAAALRKKARRGPDQSGGQTEEQTENEDRDRRASTSTGRPLTKRTDLINASAALNQNAAKRSTRVDLVEPFN